jgi:hypothetical protein
MGQCKSGGKDFKREQLRENMEQSKSKKRGFKAQRSKVLKKTLVARF